MLSEQVLKTYPYLAVSNRYKSSWETQVAMFSWCDEQFGAHNWYWDPEGIRFKLAEHVTFFVLFWEEYGT